MVCELRVDEVNANIDDVLQCRLVDRGTIKADDYYQLKSNSFKIDALSRVFLYSFMESGGPYMLEAGVIRHFRQLKGGMAEVVVSFGQRDDDLRTFAADNINVSLLFTMLELELK